MNFSGTSGILFLVSEMHLCYCSFSSVLHDGVRHLLCVFISPYWWVLHLLSLVLHVIHHWHWLSSLRIWRLCYSAEHTKH